MLAHSKVISLVLAINLVAGGFYAFATQNTPANSKAVYKTSLILGYDVTGIIFDVNEAEPAVVDTITFQVTPASGSTKANRVKIQTKPDGKWTECSLIDAAPPTRVATCTFESLAAEDVIALKIVAR